MSFHDPTAFDRANPLQKLLRRFGATAFGSKLFSKVLHHIDIPIFKLTKGRHTLASLFAGLPIVMLTTTGAKSGRKRTVPLLGLPVEGGVAVIASNYGQHKHPAWYYNLRANPDCEYSIDGRVQPACAVEAVGDRRDAIWRAGTRIYPGWSKYEVRAAHRTIHVFVLEPAQPSRRS